MTESGTLNGWTFEIRNIDADVDSYINAKFKFDGTLVILPNQTLLLISDRSSASDVVSHRVYNLYQKHRDDLGLDAPKSMLVSSVGFHLLLKDKDNNTVDAAGNVMLDGPRRTVVWALPETAGNMRYSIIRAFGTTKKIGGMSGNAQNGTMMSSWQRVLVATTDPAMMSVLRDIVKIPRYPFPCRVSVLFATKPQVKS